MRWSAWHLHLSALGARASDQVVRDVVGPAVDWCRDRKPQPAWFFIRYWQFGPHIRLRLGGLDDEGEREIDGRLRECLAPTAEAPGGLTAGEYHHHGRQLAAAGEGDGPLEVGELRPAGVYRQPYEPEFHRYGGPRLMPLSEQLFQHGSELALGFTRLHPPDAARAGLGLRATWAALDAVAEDRRASLCHRAAAGAEGPAGVLSRRQLDGPAPTPVQRWADQLVAAMAAWRSAVPEAEAERILHAHIHMLHNRLGLTIAQEQHHFLTLAAPADLAVVR